MKIIINEKQNKDWGILNKVQQKTPARTIDIEYIYNCTKTIIDKLEITKKALEGTRAYCDKNAQTFPNCYKGIPESTQISIIFDKGNWKLNRIYRGRTETKEFDTPKRNSQKNAIIKKLLKILRLASYCQKEQIWKID